MTDFLSVCVYDKAVTTIGLDTLFWRSCFGYAVLETLFWRCCFDDAVSDGAVTTSIDVDVDDCATLELFRMLVLTVRFDADCDCS